MSKIQTNQIQHTANGAATFTLPTADGSANQVIKTNGSGVLSFTAPHWVHGTETALNGNTVVIENGVPDGASHIRYLLRYVSTSGTAQPFIQVELNNNGTIKNSNYIGASTTTRGSGTLVQGNSDKTDGLNLWQGYTDGGNTLFGVVDIYRIGTNGSDGTNYIINFQGLGNSSNSGYDATHSGQAYFELGTGSTDYVSGLRLSTGSGSVTFDNGYIQQSYLLS